MHYSHRIINVANYAHVGANNFGECTRPTNRHHHQQKVCREAFKREEKGEAFKRGELSHTSCSLFDRMSIDKEEIVPPRQIGCGQSGASPTSSMRKHLLYHGYLLKGSPEHALKEGPEELRVRVKE